MPKKGDYKRAAQIRREARMTMIKGRESEEEDLPSHRFKHLFQGLQK
jgi:hypothetical protein